MGKLKSIFELAENLSLVLTKLATELGLAQPQLVLVFFRTCLELLNILFSSFFFRFSSSFLFATIFQFHRSATVTMRVLTTVTMMKILKLYWQFMRWLYFINIFLFTEKFFRKWLWASWTYNWWSKPFQQSYCFAGRQDKFVQQDFSRWSKNIFKI